MKARLLLAALYIETSCFPNVESLETMRSLETALTVFKLPDVVGESGGSQRGGGQGGAGVRGEAHQEQQQDGAHLTINKGYTS